MIIIKMHSEVQLAMKNVDPLDKIAVINILKRFITHETHLKTATSSIENERVYIKNINCVDQKIIILLVDMYNKYKSRIIIHLF